ncbi:MAG TPA: beta-ketoacyl synthase chain length factor [Polyangiales bacterium]|nr:beta-ketoacyl synthase chain length factor [Polyangiales bacterium]
MSGELYVRGVGVWSALPLSAATRETRAENADAHALGSRRDVAGSAAAPKPAAALLSARMRGRASPLTLMFAEVAEQAARSAGVSLERMPSVFGSAYGEMNTTATLLSQLWAADGQLSPAKFQASVHNTAAAQLSIALHNSSFTTSIAAGHDTVAMCLIEAWAWLARHPGQVLVACADEGPTAALQPGAAYPPVAAAFVLDNVARRGLARILLHAPEAEASELDTQQHLEINPVTSAVALAELVLHAREPASAPGLARPVALNLAAPRGYRVSVEPVEPAADDQR